MWGSEVVSSQSLLSVVKDAFRFVTLRVWEGSRSWRWPGSCAHGVMGKSTIGNQGTLSTPMDIH